MAGGQWRAGRGGRGAMAPPSEDFLGGAKTQRGRQNWSKGLVKTFVTIRESDEAMKEKWTEFYRDLRSVWQCLSGTRHWQQPQHFAPVPLFLISSFWQINWQADFRCARFFGNLDQRMIKLLTAANTAWMLDVLVRLLCLLLLQCVLKLLKGCEIVNC